MGTYKFSLPNPQTFGRNGLPTLYTCKERIKLKLLEKGFPIQHIK